MKVSDGQYRIDHSAERENLWHALTPQFFPTTTLIQSIELAQANSHVITDEASAMEYAGHPVHLVAGRSSNIKVTTPDDLVLADFYLTQQGAT